MKKFIVGDADYMSEYTTFIVESNNSKAAIQKVMEWEMNNENSMRDILCSFWETAYFENINSSENVVMERFKKIIYKEFSNKTRYKFLTVDDFYREAEYIVENDIPILDSSENFRKTLFKYTYKNIVAVHLNKLQKL